MVVFELPDDLRDTNRSETSQARDSRAINKVRAFWILVHFRRQTLLVFALIRLDAFLCALVSVTRNSERAFEVVIGES